MITITEDKSVNLSWLPEFYQSCGYGGSVGADDRVFFAENEGTKLGVVRLAAEEGFWILRGMQVIDSCKGSGIGCKLLQELVAQLREADCYCLPYTHLESFYGKGGFVVCPDDELPDFLLNRKAGYLNRGMDVIAMQRSVFNK